MRTRRLFVPGLIVAPAILGGLVALVLLSTAERSPVYAVGIHLDLGSLFLGGGLLVSLGLLLGWTVYLGHFRQRERRLERLRQNHLLGRRRFLRQLDHELKNPLTALRMEMAYLAGEAQPEEYGQVLADMSLQVERLSRLVTDLRKLAQLEELQLVRGRVALDAVLQEVMEAAQDHPNFEGRQVRLNVPSHPRPLPAVSGDRGLLWLACFNLLDNALKFTPPEAQVEMKAFESGACVVLAVSDNGPGIAESDLPHIFEELYRGRNARDVPGSGLGLALVRTIASLHGGSITASSRPSQGTTFRLRLPIFA